MDVWVYLWVSYHLAHTWKLFLDCHVRLFKIPWTAAQQVPLSMGFPRQKYWSELPFPSPGHLPNPGIKHGSPALAGRFFTIWATREAHLLAHAAAKSLQSCPTLCNHIDGGHQAPRLWDSPGKNTGVGCHFLLQCMKVKSESEVAQSCPTLSDPMDCSLPGSYIHGIFQAKYWSGVPLPSPNTWK